MSSNTSIGEPFEKFPKEILLPKKETQQEEFLKAHPEYDGRGVIIAILDTGVDPAIPSMQTTTTGERKIVDIIDCTGAGDVDTSEVRTVTDGVITGLSGRQLQIPKDWVNPSGKYHVGLKPIYQLYDKNLRNTMKKQRKEEIWDPYHQMTNADALRSMTKHEESFGGFSDKMAVKLEREDLASKIDFLKSMEKADDRGPVADCLVWYDGIQWKACLDTSFRGRLNLCRPMGNFSQTGEYSKLTDKDEASYTFRIDQNGNWLEIAVCCGSHGSHVANIAAAHLPNDPARNGLAPGAKILSLCIGDNRLDSMETGTGLTRAFNYCAQYGVQIANMSFGEGSHLPDRGRIIEELRYLIEQHKVVFVSSAGNNGPALTTVGAPGATTSGAIGVGAYLAPEMADPLYGVFNAVEGNLYPWSSRGPAADGWLGVSICAPGAALTGVPKYTHHGNQMMNGTSMSSPNATGAIACLLSALQQQKKNWTPYTIRVALENSALLNSNIDKFSQGHGLVQVSKAFDAFLDQKDEFPDTLSRMDVHVVQGGKTMRGVYLREAEETKKKHEFTVAVTPKFMKLIDPNHKIDFERHFILKTTAPWVTTPATFVSTSQQRTFFVEVDPTAISEGECDFAEVLGIDASRPELGPLFRVPVTVVKPLDTSSRPSHVEFNFDAPSGVPVRHFITVPEEAGAMEVKVSNLSGDVSDRFILHKVQLDDNYCYRNLESYKQLGPDCTEWKHVLPVRGGRTLELCLARAWSRGKKPAKVRMEVNFHGIKRPDVVNLIHGGGAVEVRAQVAPFMPVKVDPAVSFSTLVVPVKATSAKVEPLGPRDIFGLGIQTHRLLLTYKLTMTKPADVRLELPGLCQYLYESPIDCIRFQVFSSTKEHIGNGSSYPDRYTTKLEKGEYTIQAQLRHPKDTVLESFKDTPLHVHIKIPSSISLDCYKSPKGAITGEGDKWSAKVLNAGESLTMYLGSLSDDKLHKVTPIPSGSFLLGELKMFHDLDVRLSDKSSVIYNISEYSTRSAKGLSMIVLKEKEEKKDTKTEFENAVRDLKISHLEKLQDPTEQAKLYNELLESYPNHLPLLQTQLRVLLGRKNKNPTEYETLNILISQIVEICKPTEVLQYMGTRQDYNEDDLSLKKSMDERKAALIEALIAKATLLGDEHLKTSTMDIPKIFKKGFSCSTTSEKKEESKKSTKEEPKEAVAEATVVLQTEETAKSKVPRPEFDTAYAEVLKFVAADDAKVLSLSAKHAIAHDHKGRALKYLQKLLDEQRGSAQECKATEEAIAEICDRLGWVHIANQIRNDVIIRNVEKFRPFQSMS